MTTSARDSLGIGRSDVRSSPHDRGSDALPVLTANGSFLILRRSDRFDLTFTDEPLLTSDGIDALRSSSTPPVKPRCRVIVFCAG
jgi:hypothetical protein